MKPNMPEIEFMFEEDGRELLEGMEGASVQEKLVDTDFFNRFEVRLRVRVCGCASLWGALPCVQGCICRGCVCTVCHGSSWAAKQSGAAAWTRVVQRAEDLTALLLVAASRLTSTTHN